ncbi:hypothetical protein [Granulicoccus phenolivorans]|uniref:hypothetical protein n=1 Tax=Granulicoccus phenolivorans TaxID=266854 RepID=UPI0004798502|nr:hypothetical protein [Granulicoccus phenolivorans]
MSSITDVEVVHSPPRHLGEALAALDHGVAQARAGEIAQILAIAAACDLYDVDRTVLLKGCEQVYAGGSDGTPMIGEFLAHELGPRLRVSPRRPRRGSPSCSICDIGTPTCGHG